MKSNLKLGIFLLVAVLILTALIQVNQKERINWNRTYNPKDKIPYGTFVIKNELKNILPHSSEIKTVRQTLYTFLDEGKYDHHAAIVFIGSSFSIGEAGNKKVLDFVKKGGTLFVSTNMFDQSFLDSLEVGITGFDEYKAGVKLQDNAVKMHLSNNANAVVYDKLKYISVFDQLKENATTILGYAQKGSVSVPNFVKINWGKGQVFLHLEPDVFSNYYTLQEDPFSIAYHSLEHLDGQNILWYDGLYDLDQATTPLRFILSNRALSAAWYLLLFSLILFLIFRSKRAQRAVPIIEPEPNLSIAFAKTIGSLYYENGSPGNMVLKKIEYFLFQLRKQYYLNTNDLSDPQFIYALSQRTMLPELEIKEFINQLQTLQNLDGYSIQDLKDTYQLIEQFKQKANLL